MRKVVDRNSSFVTVESDDGKRTDLDVQDAFRCLECEHISTETMGEPLYECGSCSSRFTKSSSADGGSNRCPDCGAFAAKELDDVCVECEEGEPVPVEVVVCPTCLDYVELDGLERHLETC